MADGKSGRARGLSRLSLGEAILWSEVDRCFATCASVIFLASLYLLYLLYVLRNPTTAPYFDMPFVRDVVVPTLLVLIGAYGVIVVVGLVLRRTGSTAGALVHAVVQIYAVGVSLIAYYLGFQTTPFWASVLIGGVAFGALLYDTRPLSLAVLSAGLVVVVLTVGEQTGLVAYGPALRGPPATGGHLDPSWLFGCGAIIWLQVLFIAVQVDAGARRLASNKVALVETSRVLSTTLEALLGSHRELDRTYEDLRRAQDQLVQGEKMASLGQLVAGIGHDLNNPASFLQGGLASLGGFLEGLCEVVRTGLEYESADAETHEAVAEMRARLRLDYRLRETPALVTICREGSDRIKRIVDDLRVFARADRGDRVPVDISESIGRALDGLRERLEGARVAVERRDEGLPAILADPGLLQQVWHHLLVNALDALTKEPNPTLSIRTRRAPSEEDRPGLLSCVEVEIADNGCGMDEERRARMFDPFFTTKTLGEGTGLGLSIAFGAVQNHGGTIVADSRPGHGTRIVVRLPFLPSADSR